jgi:hypothetical protein
VSAFRDGWVFQIGSAIAAGALLLAVGPVAVSAVGAAPQAQAAEASTEALAA